MWKYKIDQRKVTVTDDNKMLIWKSKCEIFGLDEPIFFENILTKTIE